MQCLSVGISGLAKLWGVWFYSELEALCP